MNPIRIIMAGTIAFAITIGVSIWSEEANAADFCSLDKSNTSSKTNEIAPVSQVSPAVKDELIQALGVCSDEEIYDALYQGQSLAEIAHSNDADVQEVIRLQIAEMEKQLDERLASGSISPDVYLAQKLELPEIIAKSVYGIKLSEQ